jgi:hypothetical protein
VVRAETGGNGDRAEISRATSREKGIVCIDGFFKPFIEHHRQPKGCRCFSLFFFFSVLVFLTHFWAAIAWGLKWASKISAETDI